MKQGNKGLLPSPSPKTFFKLGEKPSAAGKNCNITSP
jgi:hypothetical protein